MISQAAFAEMDKVLAPWHLIKKTKWPPDMWYHVVC
jgi:hypothetical protein